jgi:sigma-B regulation protein RsbQ
MTTSVLPRNNTNIVGSGSTTIVLAHGFGTDQTAWNAQVPTLAKHYRVVLFDHVGAGRSDISAYSPHRYQSLRSYASDLIELLDELQVSNAIYVGHSMSGMIGLLAALEEPRFFRKFILLGASPRYLNDGSYIGGFERSDVDGLYEAMRTNYHAWASGFAPIAMQNPEKPDLAHAFAAALQAIRPDIALGVARTIFESDHRAELAKHEHPTLVLQTQKDVAVPVQVGEYLARNISHAKFQMLDASGHFPHMSASELVTNAITGFVD